MPNPTPRAILWSRVSPPPELLVLSLEGDDIFVGIPELEIAVSENVGEALNLKFRDINIEVL
jgi:hypothetical protein